MLLAGYLVFSFKRGTPLITILPSTTVYLATSGMSEVSEMAMRAAAR